MPQTKTITTYQFDELDDAAKERARSWWRDMEDVFWSEHVIDDADQCAKVLGISIDRARGAKYTPAIYWSGFSSQGDGAGFEGRWTKKDDAPAKIREHAPQDAELHRIADALASAPEGAWADVSQPGNGVYLRVRVDYDCEEEDVPEGSDDAIAEALRNFAHWIYRSLEREYEWTNADEQVDESIRCNEYLFTEDGLRSTVL